MLLKAYREYRNLGKEWQRHTHSGPAGSFQARDLYESTLVITIVALILTTFVYVIDFFHSSTTIHFNARTMITYVVGFLPSAVFLARCTRVFRQGESQLDNVVFSIITLIGAALWPLTMFILLGTGIIHVTGFYIVWSVLKGPMIAVNKLDSLADFPEQCKDYVLKKHAEKAAAKAAAIAANNAGPYRKQANTCKECKRPVE